MKQDNNSVWRFFASVKLALFTLFILAVTSIIGTIIPQGESPGFYIQKFGPNTAKIFQMLDVPDMYNSWWFVALLAIFSMNLIVCTIDRLPNVWRMVVLDNLATDPGRLEKMGHRSVFFTKSAVDATAASVRNILADAGWKTEQAEKEGGTLIFSQKGAWSRLGVYIVHTSIIVIFIGAIIGTVFGYKASIMLPEGATADRIFKSNAQHTVVPLDFELRCDNFSLTYYPNGAPKEFRSDLVVLDKGKEVLSKSIVVNDPLDYGGLTFYQSSYQELPNEFMVAIKDQKTGESQEFIVPPRRQATWPEENVTFGIINMGRSTQIGKKRYKIWFNDGKAAPSEFWVEDEAPVVIERPDRQFDFSIKQRFATGLQIAKDPGVWTVYIGCSLMLIGLYVAFFLSHRRIWVYITKDGKQSRILLSGSANKNRIGFERDFDALSSSLEQSEKIVVSKG